MDSHNSLLHKGLESSLQNSPTSSTPLRKSIIAQKLQLSSLSENDDEAERVARRREMSTSRLSNNSANSRRHSLGLGFLANMPAPQMAERISLCIKLSTENKINIKNAFSLEMIDFMTYMVKKQDANMSNLQMASTSLDVSTKIYGFRVDSLHTDILKIAGGLDKQVTDQQTSETREEATLDDAEGNVELQKKKKKKKAKQRIISTVEALKGNVEIMKPVSMIGEGDMETTDMLYQATLPNHASSGFYQHLYNDVIVDVVENESNLGSSSTRYNIPVIEDFSDLEVCASYSKFEFLGWSVEDEPEEMPGQEDECDDEDSNNFQFDLDASVRHDDDENPMPEPMNYFDIRHDDYEANVHGFQKVVNRGENIVDAHEKKVTPRTALMSEYSFIRPNMKSLHWAGPSHWKFRKFARPSATATTTSKTERMAACMQASSRKKREILSYDENRDMDAKFAASQANKLQVKTAKSEWSAGNLTLPEDMHYDIVQVSKCLYLHPELVVKSTSGEGKEDAVDADVSDGERYDYNNPNDTLEYCPDVSNNDAGRDDCNDDCNFEDDAAASANVSSSQGFTGDNMVAAPKLPNKVPIPYCVKAKKIDMQQLKKSIWTCLKSRDNADTLDIGEAVEDATTNNVQESKRFSNVYKQLPKLLSKANAEALSVPISFISLLHLANDKELNIHSLPDMSDVIVQAN
ncbi:hypothetical protein DMN91_009412 [Ooceraea biroi]|uniref:Condensin complex subunit 2 n=1 Tax=Ooceraea biroi TaxID=2015173 RepID=A0A026WIU2_OOCBI|nr:condensin complex subunit 2 [Ooceraea biroi]EZA55019.1 Condensin complex subunit [Ooceraea biroi]RLU19054.1 hypothetical protein DMN91_009412 [Ooceraea biroi]